MYGGDDARLAMLAGPLATKLVGRESSRTALELLASVLAARGVAVPALPEPEPEPEPAAAPAEPPAEALTPEADHAKPLSSANDAAALHALPAGPGSYPAWLAQQPAYPEPQFEPDLLTTELPPGLA